MKKLTLMMAVVPLVAGTTTLAVAQPQAPNGSSAVSSYSPPIEHRAKKPKQKKPKKGASTPAAAPSGASQQ
ncbi:hypothetical protein GCM10027093_49280 [Paraburkholderia jirisanensis]